MKVALALAGLTSCVAGAAMAQTAVGDNVEAGLTWSVAAPGGASWSLDCRFTPVTHTPNQYERRWANRMQTTGAGPQRGRLPVNNGRCWLTKTGGSGPIGIAVVRGAEVVADGVTAVGEQARVGLI